MNNIIKLYRQVWKAMQTQDIDVLEKVVHENALFVHMGANMTKETEISVIKEKELFIKRLKLKNNFQEIITIQIKFLRR